VIEAGPVLPEGRGGVVPTLVLGHRLDEEPGYPEAGGEFLEPFFQDAREGQQVVPGPFEHPADRGEAVGTAGLPPTQFLEHKVEQLPPGGEVRPGQGEDIPAHPVCQNMHVVGQPHRLGLGVAGGLQTTLQRRPLPAMTVAAATGRAARSQRAWTFWRAAMAAHARCSR